MGIAANSIRARRSTAMGLRFHKQQSPGAGFLGEEDRNPTEPSRRSACRLYEDACSSLCGTRLQVTEWRIRTTRVPASGAIPDRKGMAMPDSLDILPDVQGAVSKLHR